MKLTLTLILSLLVLLICSCEKDNEPVYDEYTGKKVLPFVERRANSFGFANMISVRFIKDTIVLENDEYLQPVTDSVIDTVQYYTKYVEPILHEFSMQVYQELFTTNNGQPINDFDKAFKKNLTYDPEKNYGNMMVKIIHHSFYIQVNGEYIERKILFYYDAASDEYFTDLN